MLPPKWSWDNSFFLSPAFFLLHPKPQLPMQGPPSHTEEDFWFYHCPKLYCSTHSSPSMIPASLAITLQKPWPLTSSIFHVHRPLSLLSEPIPLPHPQLKTLTPALAEFLSKVLQRWLQSRHGNPACHLTQDQVWVDPCSSTTAPMTTHINTT